MAILFRCGGDTKYRKLYEQEVAKYNSLQSQYNSLNSSYNTLNGNYNSLLNTYNNNLNISLLKGYTAHAASYVNYNTITVNKKPIVIGILPYAFNGVINYIDENGNAKSFNPISDNGNGDFLVIYNDGSNGSAFFNPKLLTVTSIVARSWHSSYGWGYRYYSKD